MTPEPDRAERRVALVSGAARGLGAHIARTLARDGYHLTLLDLDESGLATLSAELEGLGAQTLTLRCDVRDPAACSDAVGSAVGTFGSVHSVVCNAGIARDGVVWKMDDEAWRDVLDVNLSGTFHLVRAAVPTLRANGVGRIVTISSINGLRGKFGQSNYAASKAGLIGFTKSVAREVGRFGVTANVVAPGMVLTEMTRALPPEILAQARDDTVLGRLTEPADVAEAVAFLCSDRARCITGEVLRVDCGQYI